MSEWSQAGAGVDLATVIVGTKMFVIVAGFHKNLDWVLNLTINDQPDITTLRHF